ncbi:hypothetical protein VNO80_14846 [Phaseolus coccineus]|uniref:Uncharacterized protein n=1 Tax=Phaseolus coccineus TaxID=3886 RepID=A0AAN9MKH1_PHACN
MECKRAIGPTALKTRHWMLPLHRSQNPINAVTLPHIVSTHRVCHQKTKFGGEWKISLNCWTKQPLSTTSFIFFAFTTYTLDFIFFPILSLSSQKDEEFQGSNSW